MMILISIKINTSYIIQGNIIYSLSYFSFISNIVYNIYNTIITYTTYSLK